jgi:hypothetical protein
LFGTELISPDNATQLTLTVRDPLEGLDRRCRELPTTPVAKAECDECAISNTEQAVVTRINHSANIPNRDDRRTIGVNPCRLLLTPQCVK